MNSTGGFGRASRAGPPTASTSFSDRTKGSPGGMPGATLTACRGSVRIRSPSLPETMMAPVFPLSSGRRMKVPRGDDVAHAEVSRRTRKQAVRVRGIPCEPELAPLLLIHFHCEPGSPDADGGHRSLETSRLGGEFADEAGEVGQGPPGELEEQAEFALGRREDEAPEDQSASRSNGKGGIVSENDAQCSVGAGVENVAG